MPKPDVTVTRDGDDFGIKICGKYLALDTRYALALRNALTVALDGTATVVDLETGEVTE
jgi:hypothetical protein